MYECETCTAAFWDEYDVLEHMDDEGHWPECETCTRTFRTQASCNQHMDNTNHWAPIFECETCPKHFRTRAACDKHMNSSNHWSPAFECETCTKWFRSQHAAYQHMNAAHHWAPRFPCETCGKKFYSERAADQHMNQLGHWAPRVPCETCGLKFFTQDAANDHMKDWDHYKHYCKDCDISFQNENNLRMHLNSSVHRGSTITCPFCTAKYTTASGLMHHLERAACPRAPQLNRDTILRMVRQRDPHGAITNKQIGWHKKETVTFTATDRAYNGVAWECYLCHKMFKTNQGLNTHLNSPAHQQKVYRCPNAASRCGKQFTTLAALFNHLESETCRFLRFEKVQQQIGNIMQGRKVITFS